MHEQKWQSELGAPALIGVAGRAVRAFAPHTEAHPAGILIDLLVSFGNAVGRGPYFEAGHSPHRTSLFLLLVGKTARARKGTTRSLVHQLMSAVDPEWAATRVTSGLSTGEGLIEALAGSNDGQLELAGDDVRILFHEAEFARTLKAASRDTNTLTAVLRSAWDGSRLSILTRQRSLSIDDHHVSVIAHITEEELSSVLKSVDFFNGFANRFLVAVVERHQRLPEGGTLATRAIEEVSAEMSEALSYAKTVRTMTRSVDAEKIWADWYLALSDDGTGPAGALKARAEAQVLRVSMVYALLDRSSEIQRSHIDAAIAVWEYSERSADRIFSSQSDRLKGRLLALLDRAGVRGMSRTDQHAAFSNHASKKQLESVRSELAQEGVIETFTVRTNGRPKSVDRLRLYSSAPPLSDEAKEADNADSEAAGRRIKRLFRFGRG